MSKHSTFGWWLREWQRRLLRLKEGPLYDLERLPEADDPLWRWESTPNGEMALAGVSCPSEASEAESDGTGCPEPQRLILESSGASGGHSSPCSDSHGGCK